MGKCWLHATTSNTKESLVDSDMEKADSMLPLVTHKHEKEKQIIFMSEMSVYVKQYIFNGRWVLYSI